MPRLHDAEKRPLKLARTRPILRARDVAEAGSVARTVADWFRFRNEIGLDVALEALTHAWRSKRLDLDELNRIAKKLRVQRVMMPYIEMVVL